MYIKRGIQIAVVACLLSVLGACKGNEPIVDPTIRLAYEKDPSDINLENLSKAYGSYINKNRKTGVKQPGVYCDYAVALVKQGKRAEANSWFNKEMDVFPSSRQYVMQLKKQLIPEYQDNNSINIEEASVEGALPPASRAAAEERASGVMDQVEDGGIDNGTTTKESDKPAKKKSDKKNSKKKSKKNN